MRMKVNGPTEEQKNIINCTGNIVVTAKPGSGKTYVLVEKIALVLPELLDYQGVIAISFTNKASNELKQRCRLRGVDSKQSFWGTIDRFYVGQIIIPFASHLTGKVADYNVLSEGLEDSEYQVLLDAVYPFSETQKELVIKALSEGVIPLKLTGEIALLILDNVPGAMDYIKSKYRYIFIDEYQDCGKIQHQIFTKLIDNGLIGVAVGDINQAIYGFTGRFPEYLISLIARDDFEHFELSKNHRCHESISEYSLGLFGASRYIPNDTRVFRVCIHGNEGDIANRIDTLLERIKAKYEIEDNNHIAILCRSNSTVDRISMRLETPHKVFHECVLDNDSSEWGRFFRDFLISYFDNSVFPVDFVEQFFSSEVNPYAYSKALKLCHEIFSCAKDTLPNREQGIIQLAKMIYPNKINQEAIDKLHFVISNPLELNSYAQAECNEINVMTLHKSKGLEFDVVFHMDMYKYIIPNEYGNDQSRLQDLNLHYVGITRAKKACYILLGTKRYRNKQNDYIDAVPSPFLSIQGLGERRNDVVW